ncbi:tellurite resistance TerB family protein [Stutzerimonas tarimensis]|uniref:Tellurite resistance TerB family protein n=1 Tax=Stutzerimonas tarimensis TaxID=1507735 RepID=A0ABV7T4L4_9GAMM
MDTRGLLDLLLKSSQIADRDTHTRGAGTLGQMLGNGPGGALGQALRGGGKGALATGAMGMLLGRRAGRLGGKASRLGSLAMLGMVTYKAYQGWQAQQAERDPVVTPRTIDRVPPDQAESHGRAILKAVVAASKADGHVDERERTMIESELDRLAGDSQLSQWLQHELSRPLDPVEVASAATTPETAAEMYVATLLIVDEQQDSERAYLEELARALRLDPDLRQRLEAEARAL